MPFGAVQLSPDTGIKDWDHCSGYHYSDSSILGFSHTHLNGTGCIDLLDVLLMPATDDFKFDPHSRTRLSCLLQISFFSQRRGGYSRLLSCLFAGLEVKAELTATERAGIRRCTFPKSDNARFLLDLAHAGDAGTDTEHPELPPTPSVRWASLKIVGNDTIVSVDYCYDDSAAAIIAKAAGQEEDAVALTKRSSSYVNLFNKETGFIRPRYTDGRWAAPFNPKSIKITNWRDYTEANA
jgi:putative alpha-1,2-mannosidase